MTVYHMEKRHPLPATRDASIQDRLLVFWSRGTGVELPSLPIANIERSVRNKASLPIAQILLYLTIDAN
jgi:hypothetical protein